MQNNIKWIYFADGLVFICVIYVKPRKYTKNIHTRINFTTKTTLSCEGFFVLKNSLPKYRFFALGLRLGLHFTVKNNPIKYPIRQKNRVKKPFFEVLNTPYPKVKKIFKKNIYWKSMCLVYFEIKRECLYMCVEKRNWFMRVFVRKNNTIIIPILKPQQQWQYAGLMFY